MALVGDSFGANTRLIEDGGCSQGREESFQAVCVTMPIPLRLEPGEGQLTIQVVIGLHTLTTHLASILFIAVTMSGTTLLMSLGNVSPCDSGAVNLSIVWIRKFRLRW